MLLKASDQLRRSGCRLVLVAVPATVQKVMEIVGMDKLVPMVASVEHAATALGHGVSPNAESRTARSSGNADFSERRNRLFLPNPLAKSASRIIGVL